MPVRMEEGAARTWYCVRCRTGGREDMDGPLSWHTLVCPCKGRQLSAYERSMQAIELRHGR